MKRIVLAIMLTTWPAVLAGCGGSSTSSSGASSAGGGGSTKVCIMSEFRTRDDGLPGLQRAYGDGFKEPPAHYTDISGTAEKNIANGDCIAGEVFTTDSTIAANSLYVLRDDKNLFPPDSVGLIVRSEVLKKYPAISALMGPVAAKITSDEITKLNKQVEIDNQKVDDVAKAWLQSNNFLSGPPQGGPGPIAPAPATSNCPAGSGSSGSGAHVSIGSKSFAEEQLLATITKQVLEANGFSVDYSLQAKDPGIGQALSGQIDMLWQYTGTELQNAGYLNLKDFPRDLQAAFTFVAQKDDAKGLCWVAPAPMNDTNGLAIKASDKGTVGSTLSDFAKYLTSQ